MTEFADDPMEQPNGTVYFLQLFTMRHSKTMSHLKTLLEGKVLATLGCYITLSGTR